MKNLNSTLTIMAINTICALAISQLEGGTTPLILISLVLGVLLCSRINVGVLKISPVDITLGIVNFAIFTAGVAMAGWPLGLTVLAIVSGVSMVGTLLVHRKIFGH